MAVGSGARLFAHEGHEHKVMGTVTMAAVDHVMLKDKDGKNVTVKVTKDTKVRAKPTITPEEIKAGTRVVITAVEGKDKTMTATTIEVGVAAAANKCGLGLVKELFSHEKRNLLFSSACGSRAVSSRTAHVSVRPRESKPGAEEQYTVPRSN